MIPKIPSMRCDAGCGQCCGPAPMTEAEYRKVLHVIKAKAITLKHQGLTCPLYLDGACSIYDARPFACRFFGHVPELQCARGYNVNVPQSVAAKFVRKSGPPNRVTHDLLVTLGVCASLEDAFRAPKGEPT